MLKITLLVGALLSLQTLCLSQDARPQQVGRVTGTVYDPGDAVFVGMTVVLRGAGVERKVRTNEAGVYSVEVPAGSYEISLDGQGLLPYRRAPFLVRAGRSVMINAAPSISSIPVGVLYVGPPEDAPRFPADKPLKYDSFDLVDATGSSGEMLIEHKGKRSHRGIIEYGLATVSYDALLIYGEKVRYDKKRSTITAEGGAFVEDGSRRAKGRRVTARVKGGLATVLAVE